MKSDLIKYYFFLGVVVGLLTTKGKKKEQSRLERFSVPKRRLKGFEIF